MNSKFTLLAILLAASIDRSQSARLNADGFDSATKRTEQLDDSGRVILSWELNEDETEVTFELWANTTGFVGFGISPQGGMAGADIFIAGVGTDGLPYSSDRFAPASQTPTVDEHEDWTLLEASENETTTYLRFSRALYTCDEDEDFPITNGTNRVIWALGVTDNLEKHLGANRGTRSISLLAAPSPQLNETGMETWEGMLDMEMPSEDTSYWCSLHKGPPMDHNNYIIGFDAVLPNEFALQHTHHFVLYECVLPADGSQDETFENLTVTNGFNGHACFGGPNTVIPAQHCANILYVWAKGGKRLTFPEDVAYLLGQDGVNKTKYFLLETHYDNPQKVENLSFATGVRIFYTNQPRKHEAAQLVVMHASDVRVTVPPNTTDFVVTGQCGSACTADRLGEEGISIFNSLLHSHLSGRKLKLRHFREGVELPWLDYDDHYDFNYQQNKHLGEPVKVLPGDHLTYECTYDSTWTGGRVVTGGSTTKNEMCEAFLWYYPKLDDLTYCGSSYNYDKSFADYNITKWNSSVVGANLVHYIQEPEYLRGDYEDSMSYKFNWTEEFKKQLQERRRYGDHDMTCYGSPENIMEGTVNYPKDYVEFVPKDFCGGDGSTTRDPSITSTSSTTRDPSITSTSSTTLEPSITSTSSTTTDDSITSTDSATTDDSITSTDSATTDDSITSTDSATTDDSITSTDSNSAPGAGIHVFTASSTVLLSLLASINI